MVDRSVNGTFFFRMKYKILDVLLGIDKLKLNDFDIFVIKLTFLPYHGRVLTKIKTVLIALSDFLYFIFLFLVES